MDECAFSRRLSQALCHGERLRRELRLTPAEADWVARNLPAALTPLGDGWYDLKLMEAY